MNKLLVLVGSVVAGLLFFNGSATASMGAKQESGQVIIDWNQIAQQSISGQPFLQTRSYAMVHIAMADAVIAIDGSYDPFHVHFNSPLVHGASARAAAAQAAHDVLIALIPANQPAFDAALALSLKNIAPGQQRNGIRVGKRVAMKVLAWRENDGYASANPQPAGFLPSTLPGIWRQTASGPAQFSALVNADPFGLISTTQFLPVTQPQLESDEYATDYNDVKDNGSATSATRTLAQTRMAQLFANAPGPYANATNFFRVWHNVARDISQAEGMNLVETARLFALLTASVNDSLMTSHASKFTYRLWRPETAIAAADIDNNGDTIAEAGWVPLLVTPPYPSHASNASCIGASAAQTLVNVFQTDSKSFTATWYTGTSPPQVVHAEPYSSIWAMGHDTGSSRVWGGIRFRF